MRKSCLALLQAMAWFLLIFLLGMSKVTTGASVLQRTAKVEGQNAGHEAKNEFLHQTGVNSEEYDKNSESKSSENNPDQLKSIDKRSAYGYDDQGYGSDWDTSSMDPGYESYLQSLHYDPMMAWGRRKRVRQEQYDNAKRYYDSDYPEDAYAHHMTETRSDPQDGYMESVYMPHHFFHSFKRSLNLQPHANNKLFKRSPNPAEMGARGFHEGIFTHNFGEFSPVRRKKREAEKANVSDNKNDASDDSLESSIRNRFLQNPDALTLNKRRFGMDASGFHGDTFSDGWGTFSTMRKRLPEWDTAADQGDQFTDGYGYFDGMFKRRPEMDAMGFHGDTFNGGFGDFYPMKKRRPEMTSSGFYGDTFSNGFGDFYTMKKSEQKRRPEMTSSGFYGDTFSNGFGDFYTMRKRILNRGAVPYGSPSAALGSALRNKMNKDLKKENEKR